MPLIFSGRSNLSAYIAWASLFLLPMESIAAKSKADSVPSVPGRVLTAMSTPLVEGHPMLILQSSQREEINTNMKFDSGQRYSKWSVIFEEKVKIDELEVRTCPETKGFEDGVELFLNFDEKRFYSDGGRSTVRFQPKTEARLLTLGFLESEGLCLQSILMKTSGQPTSLYVPETIEAHGDWRLGDGRLGTHFPPLRLKGKKPDTWSLSWERDLIVEGLRIWNGNQHLGEGFLDSARVREIAIKSNSGIKTHSSETWRVNLEDRRGYQKVDFKNPIPLRSLDLTAVEKFEGEVLQDPIIGEVQLLAGGLAWVPRVPNEGTVADTLEPNLQALRSAGLYEILDREMRIEGKTEVWKFRFRSDGTVAAQVFTDRARTARKWTFLGSWTPAKLPSEMNPEMKSESKQTAKGIFAKLQAKAPPIQSFGIRVVGVRYSSANFADSIPCGNQCFSSNDGRGPSAIRELPVNDILEIQRESKNYFYLRNRTPAEERTLDFSDLKLRFHSLYN